MTKSCYHAALSLPAAVLALACLPAPAAAQFSFTLAPATLSATPGTTGLVFSGTLKNSGTSTLTSDNDPEFNLITGPAGVDLTAFPIYFDSLLVPASLAPGQTTSQIFSLDIDSAAAFGQYTGNFSFGYDGQPAGSDLTVNVVQAVPEASSQPLLALGSVYIGLVLWRRQTASVRL